MTFALTIRARREMTTIALAALIFVALLYPNLQHARREARDGLRRDQLALIKQQIEQYNNLHQAYPLQFDAAPNAYVVLNQDSTGATAWYLRAALENPGRPSSGYDAERGRNYIYRIVREGGRTYYDICGGTLTCGVRIED